MDASLLAVLNEAERLLVAETEPTALAQLDEDAVVALHTRVRRARSKYVGQYRRGAAARVGAVGSRGQARPKNTRAALKAEAFEQALARVSRRLGALAAQSAAALKAERLEAARAAKRGGKPAAAAAAPTPKAPTAKSRSTTQTRTGDRALRSPASEKRRAGTTASGARRQAKRDSR
jgi:hypothetical protein